MITRSNIDGNGRETMTICTKCSLDRRCICNGTKITLVNNHRKNSLLIFESVTGTQKFSVLKTEKENTFEQVEFEKWLGKNGYLEDQNLACERLKNDRKTI